MIMIDNNEPEEFDYWLSQTTTIKRGAYNKTASGEPTYPDFTIVSNKIIGVNRKQASEWLGGIPHWEEQLQRELAGPIDYLLCVIEGSVSVDPVFGVYGWNWQAPDIKDHRTRAGEKYGTVQVTGFPSQWDYKGLMGKLIRLNDAGIPTFFTSNVFGTATFLAELHSIAERDDWQPSGLTKLIKSKYVISEWEQSRRQMILFLMGIPGVGEDAATALLDEFGCFGDLYAFLCANSIGDIRMKSGRRLGPAMDKKIKGFLGI